MNYNIQIGITSVYISTSIYMQDLIIDIINNKITKTFKHFKIGTSTNLFDKGLFTAPY